MAMTNARRRTHQIDIGLSEEQRAGVIELLNHDLADTHMLIIKTKKHHWDVVGPEFRSLHRLWDEQYTILSASEDQIAERIRQLGGYPVGTAQGFLNYTTLTEHPGDVPDAYEMVARLQADHEQIIRTLREQIDECDAAIIELVQRRLAVSQEIGALRRATGGTRLSLAREQQVLTRFQQALGHDGAALGMMLLRQGRGRL